MYESLVWCQVPTEYRVLRSLPPTYVRAKRKETLIITKVVHAVTSAAVPTHTHDCDALEEQRYFRGQHGGDKDRSQCAGASGDDERQYGRRY